MAWVRAGVLFDGARDLAFAWRTLRMVCSKLRAAIVALVVVGASGVGPARADFVTVALKPADDGQGTILRICEVHGSRRPVTLTIERPFDAVERTDSLERTLGPVDHEGRRVRLPLRPFELVTLRFR